MNRKRRNETQQDVAAGVMSVDEHNARLEFVSTVVMVIVTAFVATFLVSLINTVCR